MSLHFPLLFIHGEDGYHLGLKLLEKAGEPPENDKQMSMKMYYAYQIHERLDQYTLLTRGGRRLFQEYVVTAYCSIEQQRLDYIRNKQNDIRNEYMSGLYDAISRGDVDGSDVGTRTILPAFTGGPRYMYNHYLDALAICRVHGNPSFFITFTCNVSWPEIEDEMQQFPQLTAADRPDIVDRVFERKLHDLVTFLREQKPFGSVEAGDVNCTY